MNTCNHIFLDSLVFARESGAIVLYLIEIYDLDHKISPVNQKESFEQLQWIAFQISGQGFVLSICLDCPNLTLKRPPYWGQKLWFQHFDPGKKPDVIQMYINETLRVFSVLESVLAKNGGYLVGGKVTAADLSFVPWNESAVTGILEGYDLEEEFPTVMQ